MLIYICTGKLTAKALRPLITPPALSGMIQYFELQRGKLHCTLRDWSGAAGLVARTWLQ